MVLYTRDLRFLSEKSLYLRQIDKKVERGREVETRGKKKD